MSEVLLKALMQLFALLTDVKNASKESGRVKVEEYLSRQLNSEYVELFLKRYDHYLDKFHSNTLSPDDTLREQQTSINLNKLKTLCDEVNQEIDLDAKILILTSLLNFILKPDITTAEERFVDMLADNLRIPAGDYWNIKAFTLSEPLNVIDKGKLLLINGRPDKPHPDIKHIYINKQRVDVWILHVKSTNQFIFKYSGERNLYLNGHKVEQGKVYPMEPGGVINTSHVKAVYYGHIAEKFITRQDTGRIIYRATDIEYKFGDNSIGIHKFSFLGKSGQLVGIMGGSGTGKSTLINVMNGSYKLSHGTITINGYDLNKDKELLKGVIGYVPQDDMLNEELTVQENLMFNARLIFDGTSVEEQNRLVEKALTDFDLVEARNLKVGTPLNKILSGGQRKRLNIALELMREPSVLFVDEPTSGLSSLDSEKVMMLLKRQVLKGKLVIINIHQPNSDLYKLLDKLLIIDQGGRIIYNGNPMNAIVYFKRKAHYVNPEERECYTCGNVKTEQPLRIIEARIVDTYGKLIRKRKVSAEEWYQQYCEEFEQSFEWKTKTKIQKEKLPPNLYAIPSRWSQFKTYVKRDALKKLKDGQYVLINLFEVPVLAFLLAYATKYIGNAESYSFFANHNIPTFLFMCIVVAIFVGLNVSAEEIIKDRKLLMREKFLNLSRSSYLNSKIMNLMGIAALQSLVLVVIGNSILEIDGMFWGYWLILFSTFAHAIMFGLNISSGLKTAVAIYVSIPLILVPQLLFSGTMVEFDKLHSNISNREFVPHIGDVMVSRWAYEALAVYQFVNNDYEKHFFPYERQRSEASYAMSAWIPELNDLNDKCEAYLKSGDKENLKQSADLLFTEISKLSNSRLKKYPSMLRKHMTPVYGAESHDLLAVELDSLRSFYSRQFAYYNAQCDSVSESLLSKYGSAEKVVELKRRYTNEALDMHLLNKRNFQQIEVYPDLIVRKKQPVYNVPDNHWGRAHFYAPSKRFGEFVIPTVWFNCIVIWIGSAILYLTLYFDLLRRLISYIERLKMHRMQKRLQKIRL